VTVNGGSVGANALILDSSTIDISDGTVHRLRLYDSSALTMSGGVIEFNLEAADSSTITMTGGSVLLTLQAVGSALTWSGGSVSNLTVGGSAIATLLNDRQLGGWLSVSSDATLDMSGGSVGRHMWTRGSSVSVLNDVVVAEYLSAEDSSGVTLNDAAVGDYLSAVGSPTVTMSGGSVGGYLAAGDPSAYPQSARQPVVTLNDVVVGDDLEAYESSVVKMQGGSVENGDLLAYHLSTIVMSGGVVSLGSLQAYDSSTIVLIGSNFMVDTGSGPTPVPYGDLTALTGTLTGTLASGDSLNNVFYQGGYGGSVTGTITLSPVAECNDGVDNDGDTLVDYPDDPGCGDAVSDNEDPACQDGIDNDGDTLVDYPDDPGCEDAASDNEDPACQDGIDNDGDGLTDFDGGQSIWGECSGQPGGCPANVSDPDGDGVANPDPDCESFVDPSEEPTCDDGIDNDGDTFVDYPDDPGCRDAASDIENPQCQDGINNDHWSGQDPNPGLIDFDGGQSIWGACTGVPGGCPANVSDPEGDGVANPDPQCVGKPWKNAERKSSSSPCGFGVELALLLPPVMWLSRRRRHQRHYTAPREIARKSASNVIGTARRAPARC
jgi:hypothetical protein